MELNWIYTFIVIVLAVLAVVDITVGVANDAVNFLNAAFGSKAASRKTILFVAAVGIMVGALTSSGMMEVARTGIFYPSQFNFGEVMILFLGMMLGDIILLSVFNALGLPTSTTVSMVFELLGAAVAVSLYHIFHDASLTVENIGQFINAGNTMVIVAGILLSVVLAFFAGLLLMYVSRIIFSFRYNTMMRKFGAVWCGFTVAAIIYFTLVKGLKGSGLLPVNISDFFHEQLLLALFILWVGSSIMLWVLQQLKVNILKITILAGTFSLALAFAGNDLVNFIGVPIAGFDSYKAALESGDASMMMGGLSEPAKADFLFLAISGVVMVLTLFFSKKAMKVTQTSIALASQNEQDERFGSNVISRGLVRSAIYLNDGYKRIVPQKMQEKINKQFVQLPAEERAEVSYDMIRAVVNLAAAAILIAIATSMKLPLSTTYVAFMVAMGSSLADRAWGRESAVYRITGVMTVIMGWFVTALAGFTIAFLVATALIWGGAIAVVLVTLLCGYIIVISTFKKKKKSNVEINLTPVITADESEEDVLFSCTGEVCLTMEHISRIYNRTMVALFKENRKALKDMYAESKSLYEAAHQQKKNLLPMLHKLQGKSVNIAHFYVQIVDYQTEVTKALLHITMPAYDHINNNHEGFSKEQIIDLMRVNDRVEEIFNKIHEMLSERDFSKMNQVIDLRDQLFGEIVAAIKSQLRRINNESMRSTKASVLYLNVLNETKTMILQCRNLLKSQCYFVSEIDTERTLSK